MAKAPKRSGSGSKMPAPKTTPMRAPPAARAQAPAATPSAASLVPVRRYSGAGMESRAVPSGTASAAMAGDDAVAAEADDIPMMNRGGRVPSRHRMNRGGRVKGC